jgi:hypothetical protein
MEELIHIEEAPQCAFDIVMAEHSVQSIYISSKYLSMIYKVIEWF